MLALGAGGGYNYDVDMQILKKGENMKMNKKLLKIVMSLILALAVVPSFAFATDSSGNGYTWVGDGTCTVSDTTYTILGDGTLTFTANTTGNVVVESGEVTIIVNEGVTLTSYGAHTVWVGIKATVTLEGGSYVQKNSSSGNNGYAVVYNNGTCTINSGTYHNDSDYMQAYYTILNHGTMTINGGTFTGDAISSSYSTKVDGITYVGSNSSLIANGYYSPTSSDEALGYVAGTNQEYPSLTINGGTFNCTSSTCIKNDECGKVVINGGEFTAKYSETFYSKDGTKEYSVDPISGYALYNYSSATINGGTFNDDVYTCYGASNKTSSDVNGATTVIIDGTFNDKVSGNDNATIEVYHGEFVNDISSYLVTSNVTDEDGNSLTVYTVTTTDDDGNVTAYDVHALASVSAAEATCTKTGNYAYYKCSYCETYFTASTDEDGNTTYTETTLAAVTIAANGHTEGEAVTENYVEATCEEDGSYDTVVYCSVCGAELSRETTTIPATGHNWDYDNIEWVWSEDYTSATGTIYCLNNSEHILTVDATITSEVTKEATTESTGTITYTATITDEDGNVYTDIKEVETDKLSASVEADSGDDTTDDGDDSSTTTTAAAASSETEESAATDTSDNTVMYIYALLGLTAACGAYYVVRRREEL